MGKIIRNGVAMTGTQSTKATTTSYNNSASGLLASNVQDAIDELSSKSPEITMDDTVTKTSQNAVRSSGIYKAIQSIVLDQLYPVGSIYLETTNTNPSAKLGGTWEAYGSSDTYLRLGNASSGGSNSYSLTSANIPSHNHTLTPSGSISISTNPTFTGTSKSYTSGNQSAGHTHSGPSHTHSIPTLSGTAASNGAHTHNVRAKLSPYGVDALSSSPCWINTLLVKNPSQWSSATTLDSAGSALSAGAHTHSVSTTANTSGSSGTGATGGISASHTHSTTITPAGSISGGSYSFSGTQGTTSSYGSSDVTAVTIEPKYVGVYAWIRTA